MRKILFALMLVSCLSFTANAQRVLFFANGGIALPSYSYSGPSSADIKMEEGVGGYFGFSGLVLNKDKRYPMFMAHTGVQFLSNEIFINLTPGATYMPDLGNGFYVYTFLGPSVSYPLNNDFKTYFSINPEAGIGYRGLLLKAGYQYGLSNLYADDVNSMKVHAFTIGLSICPQVLFPSSEEKTQWDQ